MTLHIEKPLQEPRISKLCICGPRELEQYRLEILDGIMDFAVDVQVERNGRLEPLEDYTYHHRMIHPIDQLAFVRSELQRNPEMSSRRAVIGIRDNRQDAGFANPACLQHMQFFVRDGRLDMCVLFRSNDFAQAFFMNAFAFICLQERLAAELGLPVGTYSHTSNSMHVYQNNFPMFYAFAEQVAKQPIIELTYSYADYFQEMMAGETESILADMARIQASYTGLG